MAKFKALHNFSSEALGEVKEGQVIEATVAKAEEINEYSQSHYMAVFLERVDEPKKSTGKK